MSVKKDFFGAASIAAALFLFSCGSSPSAQDAAVEADEAAIEADAAAADAEAAASVAAAALPPPAPLSVGDKIAEAISSGNSETARSLFVTGENGTINPDIKDSAGNAAIHVAAKAKNADLVSFFIKNGATVDLENAAGLTALNIAADQNDAATSRVLAAANADIHHPEPETGFSPIATALSLHDIPLLNALLTPDTLLMKNSSNETALHLAVRTGYPEGVDAILRASGNSVRRQTLNAPDKEGVTPLDCAYLFKDSLPHAECAARLITAGATASNFDYNLYFSPAVKNLNYDVRGDKGQSALFMAARGGFLGYTKLLLQRGADPNIKNVNGRTPLHEAVEQGDLDTISLLLDNTPQKADPNIIDNGGNTPMHILPPDDAATQVMSFLLVHGANPNIRNAAGNTPLHIAVDADSSVAEVTTLLTFRGNGGSVPATDPNIRNNVGKTPLFLAVERNRVALIQPLIAAGASIFTTANNGLSPFDMVLSDRQPLLENMLTPQTITQVDSMGNTALIVAVNSKATTVVVRGILDKGAYVNHRNKEGDTALHVAVRLNSPDTGLLLVERGADIFAANAQGESPLYLAFFTDRLVRDWLLTGRVLTTTDSLGETALHKAVRWKLDVQIPLMVTRGADVEARNSAGESPLFLAVKMNNPQAIGALVRAKASLAVRDTMGNSALHAAIPNCYEAAQSLLDAGINPNMYNIAGRTALHEAIIAKADSIAELLLSRKADTEIRDTDGNTALALAVREKNKVLAEMLIKAGADASARNSTGDTPLHTAVRVERSDLCSLLLDSGAQIHAKNAAKESPFTLALLGSPRMLYTLLSGNRAQQPDDEGRSPLAIAVTMKVSRAVLESIVSLGGRVGAVDREGKTPLRLAVDMDNRDAARYLVEAGSDVFQIARDGQSPAEAALTHDNETLRAVFAGKIDARDSSGNTILHYAARLPNVELARFLLSLGADKNARNTARETPFDIATRWGNADVAALLQ